MVPWCSLADAKSNAGVKVADRPLRNLLSWFVPFLELPLSHCVLQLSDTSRCSLEASFWSASMDPVGMLGQLRGIFRLRLNHLLRDPKRAVLPSRPGEFHPEPLTDPDVTLSCHPARATARRLPPSVENLSSSRYRLALSQRR